jgi:hypothetical protein
VTFFLGSDFFVVRCCRLGLKHKLFFSQFSGNKVKEIGEGGEKFLHNNRPGLPDGIQIIIPKMATLYILEGLGIENCLCIS